MEEKWRRHKQSAEQAERNASADATIARSEIRSTAIARQGVQDARKYRRAYDELSATAAKQQKLLDISACCRRTETVYADDAVTLAETARCS